ncbi:MAG: hypothetical protein GY719_30590 [bacterium]|nr:hypothetical protein [bacterium]
MSRWDYYPRYSKTGPREAKGGIKAKSRRGAIGETWWSRRFVEVLESFRMGSRMKRGRTYARKGQVMDLEVKAGAVSARVQGSRRGAYRVRLGVKTLKPKDWARVEAAMAGQALFLAKLLAGEMPQDIEDAFAACDLSLFPAATGDLNTSCSCPDWANPCKHIAATYYILAERFDEDPFLIFAWRGRTKEQLTLHLRTLRGAALPPDGDLAEGDAAAAEEPSPLGEGLETFFEGSEDLSDLHAELEVPEVPDAVLRQAGPAPIELRGANLADLLSPAYGVLTAAARARALGDVKPVE